MSDPDELAKLVYTTYYRIHPRERSYGNCHWVMNSGMLEAVSLLRDSHGQSLVLQSPMPGSPTYLLDQPVEIHEDAKGLQLIPGSPSWMAERSGG